ncbi:hypothetical protein Pth03_23410 [Planotetraspora thailandica]|uniref:Uncharacterized protein n=1 Tax=Planotetraspora thailandica TaxID=487172 RepID=A0A8J3V1U0_9ACTN|nr:hypothetical protein [Planotetraspora thailandica]GII53952.1 hypothetical protein Pth03_23410 [Planotetraspora thailandica]
MILFSAALALAIAALLILIAGWAMTQVYLVVWSMAIAVLAAVFLLAGALLKRHLLFPAGGRAAVGTDLTPQGSPVSELAHAGATASSGAPAHPVAVPMVAAPPVITHGVQPTVAFPHPRQEPTTPLMRPPAQPGHDGDLGPDDIVLVVPGRRRFHVANCRQLLGRETEELTCAEAREEGFSPCTTCLPDMSARAADEPGLIAPERGESARTTATPMPTGQAAPRTQGPSRDSRGTGNTRPGEDAWQATPSGPGTSRTAVPAAEDPGATRAAGGRRTSGGDVSNRDRGGKDADPRSTPAEASAPDAARSEAASSETASFEAAASETSSSASTRSEPGQHDWFSRTFASAPTPPPAPAPSAPSAGDGAAQGPGTPGRTTEPSSAPSAPAKDDWFRVDRAKPKTAEPASAGSESPDRESAKPGDSTAGSPKTAEPKTAEPKTAGPKADDSKAGDSKAQSARTESPSTEDTVTEDTGTEDTGTGDAGTKATGTAGARAVTARDGGTAATTGQAASTDLDDLEDPSETTQPGRAGFSIPPIPATPSKTPADSTASATPTAVRPAATAPDSGSVRQAGDTAKAGTTPAKTAANPVGTDDSTAGGDSGDSGKSAPSGTGDSGKPDKAAGSAGERAEADAAHADDERDDEETGVFAAIRPDVPRAVPAGSVRVMTGTRRYHSSECPLISGIDDDSIEIMSREAAEEAGLTHCSVCETR